MVKYFIVIGNDLPWKVSDRSNIRLGVDGILGVNHQIWPTNMVFTSQDSGCSTLVNIKYVFSQLMSRLRNGSSTYSWICGGPRNSMGLMY